MSASERARQLYKTNPKMMPKQCHAELKKQGFNVSLSLCQLIKHSFRKATTFTIKDILHVKKTADKIGIVKLKMLVDVLQPR